MAEFSFINSRGDILDLSDNGMFWLTNIDGQTRAVSEISSMSNGFMDGDIVNNIKAAPRTIILDLTIKNEVSVELAKRSILQVIKPKQTGILKWNQEGRELQIEAHVESIEMPRWQQGIILQITLHCAQPFWEDVNNVQMEISDIIDTHYFTENKNDMLYFPEAGISFGYYDLARTRNIENLGDVAVGFVCEVIAYGEVINPVLLNSNGDFMRVNTTLSANDVLRIDTTRGKKSISKNGENIINLLDAGSKWLQLETGYNELTIDSADGAVNNMYFLITYKQRYV